MAHGLIFPFHFFRRNSKKRKRFASLSQSFQRALLLGPHPTHSFLLGGLSYFLGTPRPPLPLTPPQWRKNKPTYHMIMITNFITISFKMLKNSTISLACSPIFPMAMPKAMKNPIRPVGWITLHRRTQHYKVCVSSCLSFTIPDAWSHMLMPATHPVKEARKTKALDVKSICHTFPSNNGFPQHCTRTSWTIRSVRSLKKMNSFPFQIKKYSLLSPPHLWYNV